jgi:hypothetical protein
VSRIHLLAVSNADERFCRDGGFQPASASATRHRSGVAGAGEWFGMAVMACSDYGGIG